MLTSSSARRILLGFLLIWGAWTLYAFFAASQTYMSSAYSQRPAPFWPALRYAMLDAYTWAFLTPFVLWLGARFSIQKNNAWYIIPLHFVFAAIIAIVYVQIFVALLPMIGYKTNPRLATNVMLARFHSDLLTYAVLVGLRHAADYYRKYKDRELKATQLEARLAQAQLQVLKMQLQPHFLFNTLHAISALVHKDPEGADRMISRLSEFLRLTLDSAGLQEIELKGELESLDKYLEIEQVRFGDRLTVHRSVDAETLDLLVPNLILQPLVENAVRHSIAPRAAGGRIDIRARRDGSSLVLEVEDDGAGAQPSQIVEGVGLANTRARLEQLYGASQSVALLPESGRGFRVKLTLPARTAVRS